MRAVIIDDEQLAIDNLKILLEKNFPLWTVCGEAKSVCSAFKLLQTIEVDLVLLDVQLLDGTGIDLLERLAKYRFSVVFTTAHAEYAVDAFKHDAIDYILKPINVFALGKALKKVEETVSKDLMGSQETEYVVLDNSDGSYLVAISDIVRLESFRNYTTFHLIKGRKITISKNIGTCELSLPQDKFYRTHQSHVVNLSHVFHFKADSCNTITMVDGTAVPLATRRTSKFKRLISEISVKIHPS